MRTRTIYNAMREAASILHGPVDFDAEPRGLNHRGDQYRKFEAELLRRMDERDSLCAALAFVRSPPDPFASVERIGQYMAGLATTWSMLCPSCGRSGRGVDEKQRFCAKADARHIRATRSE